MALRTGQKIVFGGAVLAVVVAAVGGWMGLNMRRLLVESPEASVSPDGKTRLRLTVNTESREPQLHLAYIVNLEPADGSSTYYSEQTPYSTRLKWRVRWLSNSEVEFSSLQGTRVYAVNGQGQWARTDAQVGTTQPAASQPAVVR